jgi:hypothetical protein
MTRAMALAQKTRRKPRPPKPAPRAAARGTKPPRTAATDDNERSSPAMAEVDGEVLEFIAAIDRFKQEHGRPFPSWSEILLIVRQLGYRRG